MESVERLTPSFDSDYKTWLNFSFKWAELYRSWLETTTDTRNKIKDHVMSLQSNIDRIFYDWLKKYYGTLYNQPANPPVMVHHIPRFLSLHNNSKKKYKLALIVLDGLSLYQWIIVKRLLREKIKSLIFEDNAVFAWIPTITSVSRQSIFSGKLPLFFEKYIYTTSKESYFWEQFWMDNGLPENSIMYLKIKGNENELNHIEDLSTNYNNRILGIMVEKLDQIMHGIKLGSAGLVNQLKQWVSFGFVGKLIEILLKYNYEIYLTSDHGNIEARGIGRVNEGVISEKGGLRARIYRDKVLINNVSKKVTKAIIWPNIGLPENFFTLLAPNRTAFTNEDQLVVCHGGTTIDEVIVPFVKIKREEK